MKYLPLLLLSALLYSCEVSVGENQNGDEHGSVKNGFSYGKKTVTINGLEELSNNEITAGENLMIQFFDVANATQKEGFQHVGISFKVTTESGEQLEHTDDLFDNLEQQDVKLDYFKAYYGIPSELIGQEIEITYSIYDKYGTVSYDFNETYKVVKKSVPVTKGVKFNTNLEGIDIKGQVFVDNIQKANTPVDVELEEDLYLYLINVNGFTLTDSILEANTIMSLIDGNGEEILKIENPLSGSVAGYEYYPLYFQEKFSNVPAGTYTWFVYIKDQLSDKFIEASTEIKIN